VRKKAKSAGKEKLDQEVIDDEEEAAADGDENAGVTNMIGEGTE
jgi:hypothetical protein